MANVDRVEMLEAAYEFLRTTRPFRGWKLPHADEVEFRITRHTDRYGHYERIAGGHRIVISQKIIGSTSTLLRIMAHEMTHLHTFDERAIHGPRFRRAAASVCRHHGFNLVEFA